MYVGYEPARVGELGGPPSRFAGFGLYPPLPSLMGEGRGEGRPELSPHPALSRKRERG